MNAPDKMGVCPSPVDAVEQAASGHHGAPMGMAEMADALWRRHLRHKPARIAASAAALPGG